MMGKPFGPGGSGDLPLEAKYRWRIKHPKAARTRLNVAIEGEGLCIVRFGCITESSKAPRTRCMIYTLTGIPRTLDVQEKVLMGNREWKKSFWSFFSS